MAIAPPPVIEQEMSMATSTIYEEVDRLCDEISTFVEYGFELIQQSAATLYNQAERNLGSENAKELVKEGDQDIIPAIDRRLSVATQGGGAGSRRRSSILQLDTRRGSIRNKDVLFPAELFGRKRAYTLPQLDEDGGEKTQEDSAQERLQFIEEQFKENITNIAQNALDIVKGTGEVFTVQLNHKLGTYERFYDLWRKCRQQRRQSLKAGPVAGKSALPSVSFAETARSPKSTSSVEEDEDKMDVEPGSLFPQIAPSVVHTSTHKGKIISTANLSNKGIMMIGSSTTKKPTAEKQQASTQSAQVKKRVKPLTRQQQMAKQKALLDKVLHVDSRMQDIRNIVMGAAQPLSFTRRASTFSRDGHGNASVELPFIAHGISGNEGQRQDKKTDLQRKMSMIEEVEQSPSSTWNATQPITKYRSTNDVGMEAPPPRLVGRRAKGRLPSLSLNISNFFK